MKHKVSVYEVFLILELVELNYSNVEISRRLNIDRHVVARVIRERTAIAHRLLITEGIAS